MNCCSEEVELWLIFFPMWVNYMHLSMQKISWTCEFVRYWIQSLWSIEHIPIIRQTTCRAHAAHTWMYHYMLSSTKTHHVEFITIHYFCSKCHAVTFLCTSYLCILLLLCKTEICCVSHARVIPGLLYLICHCHFCWWYVLFFCLMKNPDWVNSLSVSVTGWFHFCRY